MQDLKRVLKRYFFSARITGKIDICYRVLECGYVDSIPTQLDLNEPRMVCKKCPEKRNGRCGAPPDYKQDQLKAWSVLSLRSWSASRHPAKTKPMTRSKSR